MQQAIAQEQQEQKEISQPVRLVVTVEFIAYALLIALALFVRLAELDTVPLTDGEATEALAAWRVVYPNAAGEALTPSSPLVFWSQSIAFSFSGGSEITSRFLTAIGSVLLSVTPLLFRGMFGSARSFIFSLLLAFSPIVLITSRSSSPAVWTVLFAVLGLWALWRYYERRQNADALWASGFFASMFFLSESGGPVLAVILLLAAAIALFRSVISAPDRLDVPGDDLLASVREHFRTWPWQGSLLTAVMLVVLVSTGFMLYPAGFNAVGTLLGDSIGGIAARQPGVPLFSPLAAAIFYEPFLWIFAAIGVWLMVRRGVAAFVGRFLAAWVFVGVLASLLYSGTSPQHALWLIIPLAGLASYALSELLVEGRPPLMFWLDDVATFWQHTWWVRWMLAAITLSLLLIFSVHLQEAARSMMTLPADVAFNEIFDLLLETRYIEMRYSIVWIVVAPVFLIIGFFLTAGIWGNAISVQGGGLGLMAFMLLTGIGSGWNAAVTNADNPIEFWRDQATAPEVLLLRETLSELAQRESRGFPVMPLTVLSDGETITGNGVVAWELRDFVNTHFVDSLNGAVGEQIVILPDMLEPDLGGSYVGQDFVVSRTWDSSTLEPVDFLTWWLQSRTRVQPQVAGKVVLWLRQDVYDSVPALQRP